MNVNLTLLVVSISTLFFGSKIVAQKCECSLNVDLKKKEFNNFLDAKKYQAAEKLSLTLIKHQNPSCQLIGNDFMVTIYNYKQNLDSIKFYLDKQANILKTHRCDEGAKMEYFASLAQYHLVSNELEKGVDASLKSLKLAEKSNVKRLQAFLISNLCACFNRLGQIENEFIYAEKLSKLLPHIDDLHSKADAANTIASAYLSYSNSSFSSNDEVILSFARNVLKQSLSYSKKASYFEAQVYSYSLLSKVSAEENNISLANIYLDSAVIVHQQNELYNEQTRLYEIYSEKARLFRIQNKNQDATQAAKMALENAKITKDESAVVNATKLMADCYEQAADYKNASVFFKEHIRLKDKFNQKQNSDAINSLELKFNKVKNEQIIRAQKQRNELLNKQSEIDQLNINLLLVGVFVIILLFAIVYIALRQRSLKQKQQLLETEQILNRSRINPHFFFNILSSLQSFILRSDDKKSTLLQLTRFSKIMRQTLESTYNENVTLDEEIKFLREYLELQKFRKKEGFAYDIQISDELLYSDIFIPSMLLQPFIENSVEHGISDLEKGALIQIHFEELGDQLKISINDNGNGLIDNHSDEKTHISRATQITSERLKILNQKYNSYAKFDVIDTGKGVTVELYLPLTLN